MAKKSDVIEVEATVVENLPNAQFKVQLDNGVTILAHVSGKIYDLTRGRITFRKK